MPILQIRYKKYDIKTILKRATNFAIFHGFFYTLLQNIVKCHFSDVNDKAKYITKVILFLKHFIFHLVKRAVINSGGGGQIYWNSFEELCHLRIWALFDLFIFFCIVIFILTAFIIDLNIQYNIYPIIPYNYLLVSFAFLKDISI